MADDDAIDSMGGVEKAAIMIMSLGTEKAAKIFKFLDDDEIEKIVGVMAEIKDVTPDQSEAIMREGFTSMAQGNISGNFSAAKQLLRKAVGDRKAMDMLNKMDVQGPSFEGLENINPNQLVNTLVHEHPQTIALVLAHLDPMVAAGVLAGLPEEMRSDVIIRIARMDKTDPQLVAQVEQVLHKQIASYKQELRAVGGAKAVASILNLVDRSAEKNIMGDMQEQESELSEEVKNLMFIFEDIVLVEDKSMQRVLKEVDMNILTLAMKGASDELKKKFFDNLSKRAVDMIKEELEYMGPVRLKVVEEAQQKVVNVVRMLEEQGEILITGRGGKEDEIVV